MLPQSARPVSIALQVLHVGRAIPVLTQVRRFLTKAFTEEYAARSAEEAVVPSTEGDAPLPLFVMSSMLPGTVEHNSTEACSF